MYKRAEFQTIKRRPEVNKDILMNTAISKPALLKQTFDKELLHPQSAFIVGDGGLSAEDFLSMNIADLFRT